MSKLHFDILENRLVMDATAFVVGLYQGLLERTPDPAERLYWENQNHGGTPESAIVRQFETSRERQLIVIARAYDEILHRAPDTAGIDYFSKYLAAGASSQQLKGQLAGSDEYWRNHGANAAAFLNGLYDDILGRAPDAGGLVDWSAALATGTSRTAVGTGFTLSTESLNGLVGGWFQDQLHRPAKAAARDAIVAQIRSGGNDDDAFAAIVASKEHQSIAKNNLIQTGDVDSTVKVVEFELPPTSGAAGSDVPILARWDGSAGYHVYIQPGPFDFPTQDQRTIDNLADWTNLWVNNYGRKDAVPNVDFTQNMVLTVSTGKGNGGSGLAIASVQQGANLEVRVRENTPGTYIGTQAFTRPYSIVVVPKTTAPVRFSNFYLDPDGTPRLPDVPASATNLHVDRILPNDGIAHPNAGAFVIRNADDWAAAIRSLGGSADATAPLPDVDFNTSMIVCFNHPVRVKASAPPVGNTGTSVRPTSVYDGVFVDVRYTDDPAGDQVQMFMQFSVVARSEGQVTFRFGPPDQGVVVAAFGQ